MRVPAVRSRAGTRDLAILETLLAGGGLQATVVVTAIISLPFVTRELTTAEYGILATITGFVALLGFADLGIGSALTTRLAESIGKGEIGHARVAVTTSLVAGAWASFSVLVLGVAMAFALPWRNILGASEVDPEELRAAMIATAVVTGFSVIGSMGQRVLYGVLRGRSANQWLIVGAVMGAAASIIAALAHAPLFVFVLAGVGVPTLVSLICTFWSVTRATEGLKPSWGALSRAEFLSLASASGWFFLIGLSSAVGYQTDVLIVAGVMGASAAGVFSVANRLFGLILQALYPALLQLWPAFSDAYARRDLAWMRSRFRWAVMATGTVALVLGGLLVAFGRQLISAWLTDELVPSFSLLVALACWTAYSLASAPLMLLLNATGRVRAHALMAVAVAIANLPLSIVFTQHVGIVGPVIGSLIANACFAGVPGLIMVGRILREPEQNYDVLPRSADEPLDL